MLCSFRKRFYRRDLDLRRDYSFRRILRPQGRGLRLHRSGLVFLAVGLAETAGLLSWREDPFLFSLFASKAWASA